jgi:hypothetical protein
MLAQCSNSDVAVWSNNSGANVGIHISNNPTLKPLHIFSQNICPDACIRLENQLPYWGHLALLDATNTLWYSNIGQQADMILQADTNAGNVLISARNKGKAIKFSTTTSNSQPNTFFDYERFRISEDGYNTLVDIKVPELVPFHGSPILRFQRLHQNGLPLPAPGNKWNMGIDVNDSLTAFKFGAMDSTCALFDDTRSFTFSKEGNLGIGTGNPTSQFQITKGQSSINYLIDGQSTSNDFISKRFDPTKPLQCRWDVSYSCDMKFKFKDQTTLDVGYTPPLADEYTKIIFTQNGDVGIGTLEPGKKLDVNGDINITNDLYIGGKIYFPDFTLDHWTYNPNWGLTTSGRVAIGEKTIDSESDYWADSFLSVYGKILAKEIVVIPEGDPNWSDFVFDSDYELIPLDELEKEIKANKHLPGIPSAEEIKEKGQNVSQIQAKLLQKIEELTLYLIDLKKENEQMKKQISEITDNKR